MTVGSAATNANNWLKVWQGTTYTGLTSVYVQLHTLDPGAAGTNGVAASSTRKQITWNTPTGGSMTLLSLANFTGVSTETIQYISYWDASTSGNFLGSGTLTTAVPIVSGSTLTFTTFTKSFTPIAA